LELIGVNLNGIILIKFLKREVFLNFSLYAVCFYKKRKNYIRRMKKYLLKKIHTKDSTIAKEGNEGSGI